MDVYRTEEEQVEAIKKWWGENGNAVAAGVLAALVVVFGWKYWVSSTTETAQQASVLFQSIVDQESKKGADAEKLISDSTAALTSEFSSTEYGQYAALLLAKKAVEEKRYEEAVKQLQSILKNGSDEQLISLVKYRLAKVYLLQAKEGEALAQLDIDGNSAYMSLYEELKGDIYIGQKNFESARGAYAKALSAAKGNTSLLQMKLDDLAQ